MPHTTPTPDLLARLGTDPATGLSPKEVSKRLACRTDAPLFRGMPRRYADCVKKTAREPSLWLMAAVSFISLFFGRVAMGLFCLLLTLGNTALCAYFLYRADQAEAAALAYDAPLCRVLRGGRLLRVGADGLVTGDIVRLCRGDIVPADCRLLRADGLTVLERELDATDPLKPPARLDKSADAPWDTPPDPRHSPANMVYAGGLVEEGSALAVVTAVGSETHLGGLIGHIPSAHQGKSVTYFKKVAGFLSVYNLCLLCLVIPLTALGIFTVGESYEFLDIFLSVVALASLTLTEHLLAKGVHLASSAGRSAALDRDSENTAEIKSPATLERLTAMTDLFLVGSAALHDGRAHPETLRVGTHLYRCDRPDADEEARTVAEYLYLYRLGAAALPSAGDGGEDDIPLLTAFCEWAEADTEALQVKVRDVRPEGRGVAGTIPSPRGDRRVTVCLTPRFDEAEACDRIHNATAPVPMTREEQNTLYRAYRDAARQGSAPLFLIVEEDGTSTLRAMLTFSPATCRKTAGCIRNLERAGVRVTAFLFDRSDGNARALSACGLTDNIPADCPAPDGTPRPAAAARIAEGCRAFEGCSEDYISACIADLKAEGRTVGLLSVDARDVALLREADIAFTCAPSLYAAAEAGIPAVPESVGTDGEDGRPNAAVANDCSRRAAHVVVRRSSATGGGVLGVLRALRAADSFRSSLDGALRFVLLSQLIRAVMTVLPLCLGLAIAAAPSLLVSGVFVDLLVMTALLGIPAPSTPLARRKADEPIARPLHACIPDVVAVLVSSVLPWGVAGIASLCGAEFGGDLLYFGLLCTLGLQMAVFRSGRLPRRNSTVFFATFGLALVYVGALAAALVGELTPLWTLCIPLTAPAAYLLTLVIARAVAKKKEKGKKN